MESKRLRRRGTLDPWRVFVWAMVLLGTALFWGAMYMLMVAAL